MAYSKLEIKNDRKKYITSNGTRLNGGKVGIAKDTNALAE